METQGEFCVEDYEDETSRCIVDNRTLTPINPQSSNFLRKRRALKPVHKNKEVLQMVCEWTECDEEFVIMEDFLRHIRSHIQPMISSAPDTDDQDGKLKY